MSECVRVEGRAFLEGRLVRVRIGREGCRITQFSSRHVILPGMVDIHVHFRDWGLAYKETLRGGAEAALAGGVVAVADMPNTRPHIRTAELCRKRLEEGAHLPIEYRIHMGVPERLEELDLAAPRSVKIYPEDVEAYGWGHITRVLRKCAELGCKAVFHCEDPAYFKDGERPPEAETACVDKLRHLARETGASVHITHASLPYTVEQTRSWATVDVAPHHLLLDVENCVDRGLCLVNPRLRSRETRKALLAAFASGLVDIYATDHAPHALEEKKSPSPPPGICSLDVALSILLGFWKKGILSLGDAVRLYSHNPSRFLGLSLPLSKYFTVVKLEWFKVRGEEFRGACKFTPLEGIDAFGKVVAVASKGVLRLAEGDSYLL